MLRGSMGYHHKWMVQFMENPMKKALKWMMTGGILNKNMDNLGVPLDHRKPPDDQMYPDVAIQNQNRRDCQFCWENETHMWEHHLQKEHDFPVHIFQEGFSLAMFDDKGVD